MEREIRYFFGNNKLDTIKNLLGRYEYLFSANELTVMYDNPNPKLTFYDLAIDGRLRLRTSKVLSKTIFCSDNKYKDRSYCLLTWKRRLPISKRGSIRREEEIECSIESDDSKNLEAILENVLKCPRVSSYERIRHNFICGCAKITLDEFPYGLMLEFELKSGSIEKDLLSEVRCCGLDLKDSSKLSCDDMYFKLCNENGKKIKSDILFSDKEMPKII